MMFWELVFGVIFIRNFLVFAEVQSLYDQFWMGFAHAWGSVGGGN
jgi:hypothetical protein